MCVDPRCGRERASPYVDWVNVECAQTVADQDEVRDSSQNERWLVIAAFQHVKY